MRICNDGHMGIVYEGENCPLCTTCNEIQRTIGGLKHQIWRLSQENLDLKDRLPKLEG